MAGQESSGIRDRPAQRRWVRVSLIALRCLAVLIVVNWRLFQENMVYSALVVVCGLALGIEIIVGYRRAYLRKSGEGSGSSADGPRDG